MDFPEYHDTRHPAPKESSDFRREVPNEWFVEYANPDPAADEPIFEPIIGWLRIADDCAVPVVIAFEHGGISHPIGARTQDTFEADVRERINPDPDAVWPDDADNRLTLAMKVVEDAIASGVVPDNLKPMMSAQLAAIEELRRGASERTP